MSARGSTGMMLQQQSAPTIETSNSDAVHWWPTLTPGLRL
jgi:hypothetical protein